mgnify:CR=1 FL=1
MEIFTPKNFAKVAGMMKIFAERGEAGNERKNTFQKLENEEGLQVQFMEPEDNKWLSS